MKMNEIIKSRRTIRRFEPSLLGDELLEEMIDAVRYIPTGANLQPCKYITVSNPAMTEELFQYVRWAAYLAPEYKPNLEERPRAYIAVLADLSIVPEKYEFAVGAACQTISLDAWQRGIGSCIMGSIDYQKISKMLAIEEPLKLCYLIALGYPKEKSEAVEMKDNNVRYYLEQDELRVPKRTLEEVLIKQL